MIPRRGASLFALPTTAGALEFGIDFFPHEWCYMTSEEFITELHELSTKESAMRESRRDFIKTSAAFGVLTVTKATAEPGSPAAAVARKKIGLVVSTKKRDGHIAAFKQALTDNRWDTVNPPLFANGKYGPTHQELKNHAKTHIGNVDLVAAAGGLPAAVAVATAIKELGATTTRFIFLIGRYPKSNSGDDADAADLYDSPNKAGGVDQNVPAQNGKNFWLLNTQYGVAIDKVGLIVNDNDPITKPEVTEWKQITDPGSGKHPDPNFIYRITGENDEGIADLLDAISKANPQPAGIVVSSDPYLRSVGNVNFDAQLRDQTGGNFKGWVCYPYKEYVSASPQTVYSAVTPVLASNDPGDKSTAYYQLGLAAVDALNQNAAQLTTWNGSNWVSGPYP
jgi:hypothetical protein